MARVTAVRTHSMLRCRTAIGSPTSSAIYSFGWPPREVATPLNIVAAVSRGPPDKGAAMQGGYDSAEGKGRSAVPCESIREATSWPFPWTSARGNLKLEAGILDAENVIAAFSEEQVERLTALSTGQLRYWDRTGFFSPAYANENRRVAYSRIYSFKDILALRVLNMLRNQYSVPLQHLRKVADTLTHMSDDIWIKTTLYVLNKKVVFKEGDHLREIVSGQYVMGIPLATVVSDTKRDVEQLQRRSADQVGRVERSKYVNHNAWVVAGTRIPTTAVRRFKEAGYTVEQIIKEYPDLTVRDVEAALAHEEKVNAAA
jgi:DNA-binding transcriptional MerR regulator